MTLILRFLLLNAVLCCAAWMAAGRIFGFRGGIDRVLAAFVVGASAVVVLFQVLGAFGGIGFNNALLFCGGALAAVSITVALRREKNAAPAAGAGFSPMLLCFFVVFIINAAFALTTPPAATDAFLDHLVFPAEWLKAGRITLVQTLSPEQATTYYPSNGELLYLWLMLPLHDDLAAGLLEAASLAAAALACARIGRRLGMDASWAAAAAALGALAPGFMLLTRMFGVDLFFAACFMVSAAFLLPDANGRVSISEAIIAGLAAGLAAGSKYVGLAFVVLLLPLLAAWGRPRALRAALFFGSAAAAGAYWYVRNIVVTGSAFFPLGVKVAGIELMPGAYDRADMFRSYLHIPVGDVAYLAKLFGDHIYGLWLLGGMAAAFTLGAWLSAGRTGRILLAALWGVSLAAFIGARGGGAGSAAWAAAPLAGGALLIAFISASAPGEAWWKRYLLSLGVLCALFFWFVTPYNTANNYRFMAPAAFFFALLTVDVIRRAGLGRLLWPLAACALGANAKTISQPLNFLRDALGVFGRSEWHTVGLSAMAVSAAAVAAACLAAVLHFRGKRAGAAAFAALSIIFLAALLPLKSGFMEGGRHQWYAGHYLAAGWAAVGSLKEPATIAYAGNCAPYGLYGNRLRNNVVYVNTDGSDFVFHDYVAELRKGNGGKKLPGRAVWLDSVYRSEQDFGRWRAALLKKRVDYLFVSKQFVMGRVEMPVEGKWALEHPEFFKLVFQRGDIWIFKVGDVRMAANRR